MKLQVMIKEFGYDRVAYQVVTEKDIPVIYEGGGIRIHLNPDNELSVCVIKQEIDGIGNPILSIASSVDCVVKAFSDFMDELNPIDDPSPKYGDLVFASEGNGSFSPNPLIYLAYIGGMYPHACVFKAHGYLFPHGDYLCHVCKDVKKTTQVRYLEDGDLHTWEVSNKNAGVGNE